MLAKGSFYIASVLCLHASVYAAQLRGVVTDVSGQPVPYAGVEIRRPTGAFLAARQTNEAGRFEWEDEEPGAGLLQVRVSRNGLEASEVLVDLSARTDLVRITLQPASVFTRLVVTATRGSAEEAAASPHVSVLKDSADVRRRPLATLGNALEQEAGILVQQSTYAQVSPFLRGLTGYQVLNVVDGIRFNNATFRSGPNQYLAFLEPAQAQRVEAMLGPTGTQYGSDSLGGTIQVFSPESRFEDAPGRAVHGDLRLGGASADLSGHGAANVSVAGERYFWLGGVSGRNHGDLRAGHGHDSRNVFHRLFGMSPDDVRELLGSRMQDTGFRQYGVQTKVALRPRAGHLATLHYLRSVQDGVRGYKDLLGGLGRLTSTFEPQALNWFYGRYEKLGVGRLDSLSGTFSLNEQSDGSVRQHLHENDPILRDRSRVRSFGYIGQGTMHWGRRAAAAFGGEIYDEHVASEREVRNPVTQSSTRPRPLYPDGARYLNTGLFGQASYELAARLRAGAGVRLTGVRFSTRRDPAHGVPDSEQWFRDVTFHSSLRWQASAVLSFHGVVSRGFRAPNLNDLGALGLNDLGYEIPAAETIAAGALLSTDAGESATSKGVALQSLTAESLMNYEFGAQVTTGRLSLRAQVFDAELYDPIVRRTLLFPAANPPTQLAGLPVTVLPQTAAQKAQGVVAVATTLDPRAVKAFVNDGRSRYYGLEILARYRVAAQWTIETNYGYLVGRDLYPNRNIRRLPPQAGALALHYSPSSRRPWYEVSLAAAGAQSRLSGGDTDDERIGASFRRSDIAAFFHGSRVAPYLSDGVFLPTGETLRQIQDRVLPGVADNTRVPLYRSTAGWATLNFRAGYPLGERWDLAGALENALDRNYRVHGSGVDAPGRSAYLSLSYRF